MLLEQTRFKVILYSTLFGLSALLTSCGNSQQIEQFLSADPDLVKLTTDEASTVSDVGETEDKDSPSTSNNNTRNNTTDDIRLTKLPKEKSRSDSEISSNSSQDNSSTTKQQSEQAVPELPENLPFYHWWWNCFDWK